MCRAMNGSDGMNVKANLMATGKGLAFLRHAFGATYTIL